MTPEASARGLRARLRTHVRERGGRFELDIALDVPPGVTVLLGPSGSGKSLTLASLAGLVRPSDGRVTFGDEAWDDTSRRLHVPPERRRCAYVPQSLALFPHLDVAANVAFGLPRHLSGEERRARAQALLERFHVGTLGARRATSLSGGEAQRVALARAFAIEPRVLLLDEPFTGLDRALRGALLDELRDVLAASPMPTLLVTHDADEARALDATVLHLERGRMRAPP